MSFSTSSNLNSLSPKSLGPRQTKQTGSLSNGVSSEEIDEAIIRTIFLKNKRNELFVQQNPELARQYVPHSPYLTTPPRTIQYEETFKPKEERRRLRFEDKLKQFGKLGDIPGAEFKALGRKGFPSEHRNAVYAHLLQISKFEAKYGANYFADCLRVDIPSSIGRVIQADLPRTLSAFAATCGSTTTKQSLMKMLRDVLWAFAVHKPEIGYCQSMNFIAAFFLSIFGCARKAFYALVQLIDSPTSPYIGLHIPGYYSPGMSQLLTDIGALERMCRSRLGERAYSDFFESREVMNLSLIVSEWFHTVFITVFPIRTVQRIFDFIISNADGSNKVMFRLSYVVIKNLINQRNTIHDLDGVMQGHKRMTRTWVDHNGLIIAATRGVRMFSKRDLASWKHETEGASKKSGKHSSSGTASLTGMPPGITMMRLEDAIAPPTNPNLAA
jgi:hypothetical protein